jgi:2',3'-cyclic-nucleotide 2'-phosphodiesterase (5'-nucleotidase family)
MIKRISFFFLIFLHLQLGFAQKSIVDDTSIKRLTILYTNDLHSNFDPITVSWISETRKVGGFAHIAAMVKNEKARDANTLYFDAGDFFTGPNYCSLTKGEAVIDVMNQMSIDAACIGNHEFDYGWENMLNQFNKASFPILNGNIFNQSTGQLIWNNPWMIFKKNGLNIGVIGLHGKFAFYDTVSDIMRHGIEARDEVDLLQKYIDRLRPTVDLVVLLIHQGIPGRQSSKGAVDIDRNLLSDINLAKKVKGIDVMITGHAHQGTPVPLMSNGTIIVSTDALGIEMGKLNIEYDTKQRKIYKYSNSLKYLFEDEIDEDPSTHKSIEKWKGKLAEITEKKVCTITQSLTRSYGEESLLGDMVADAMMHTFPDYDLALINSGGLREDVIGPNVTIGNLISAFPFPNTVVQLEIRGDVLKELFEHSADQTNGVLQVSEGTVLQYNDSLEKGNRVVSCLINGKTIENNKKYKVLTNNFLAEGGDGFLSFKKSDWKNETHLGVIQTMIDYMKSFEVYAPKISGRVVKVNN